MAIRDLKFTSEYPEGSLWVGGAVGGIVAGIVMAIISMFASAAQGAGFWLPTKLIAASFIGVDALLGGVGTVVLGVIVHLIVSAIFGMAFAAITMTISTWGLELFIGILYSIALWVLMTFIVLPVVNPVMAARVELNQAAWFLEHVVFGVSLILTPYFERWSVPSVDRRKVAVHA